MAVEAIKAHRTTSEIARLYGVHPNLVGSWKKLALELLPELFTPQARATGPAVDHKKDGLYRQNGQIKVEMDFLKKLSARSIEDRRQWIDSSNPQLPM